ncbi:MAG: DMT family transporter [Alphaproteobacteria bacterium]
MTSQTVGSSKTVFGIFMMLGFAAFGPTIDVFAKLAGQSGIAVFQISAARFAIQALALLPFALFLKSLHLPDRAETGLYILRGGLILSATSFFFAAIVYLPLADAISIFFIEPFVLTLLGAFLLGEGIGWRRITACIVGFCGALLVIQPQYQEVGLAAIFPLGTAICFALYLILTRKMTQKAHPLAVQIYTSLAAFALIMPVLWIMDNGPIAALDMVVLNSYQIYLLIGVGIAASIAHMFITVAFRHAPVAVLAPLQYLEIISATFFGWWVFGDLPNQTTFIGILIIVGSGLYVLMREHQLSQARPVKTGRPA